MKLQTGIYFISVLFIFSASLSPCMSYDTVISRANLPKPTISYSLPFPGILPDHPLYSIKKIRDRMVIFFNRDPVKRSQTYLLLADKNLVMGDMLWKKNDYDRGYDALKASEEYLKRSVLELTAGRMTHIPTGYKDKLKLSSLKHEELINELKNIVSDEQARLDEILKINSEIKIMLSEK